MKTYRFHELSSAWRAQAARIREMDRLLARTEPADHERASGERPSRATAAARASRPVAPTSSGSARSAARPTTTSWAPWRGFGNWCR